MSSTAADLEDDLDELDSEITTVDILQDEVAEFDGTVNVDSGSTTPGQLLDRTVDTQLREDELYQQAVDSWTYIQNVTDVITQSNGSVTALKERVGDAMNVLDQAKTLRESAENILYGEFLPEFTNNSISLGATRDALGDLENDLVRMQDMLEGAEDVIQAANVTLRRVDTEIDIQSVDIQNSLEDSERTRLNSTQAQRAAQTAQTDVNEYRVSLLAVLVF